MMRTGGRFNTLKIVPLITKWYYFTLKIVSSSFKMV
jgi:hypothetical protein